MYWRVRAGQFPRTRAPCRCRCAGGALVRSPACESEILHDENANVEGGPSGSPRRAVRAGANQKALPDIARQRQTSVSPKRALRSKALRERSDRKRHRKTDEPEDQQPEGDLVCAW